MKTGEICDMDKKQRLYVEWQSFLETENGDKERRPEPRGISGGSIWCTNIEAYGETWRADQVQLVGIEFAMQRSSGYQYLIGQQMHVWCEMVADDIPELASTIKTFLAGARFYPAR